MKLLPYSNLGRPIIPKDCVRYITPVSYANRMTDDIIKYYFDTYNKPLEYVIDACANVGGNCISFMRRLNVTAFEINTSTAEVLRWNVSLYPSKKIRVKCADFIENLHDIDQCVFIDPPWYKPDGSFNADMSVSNISYIDLISRIRSINNDCLIIFKVPRLYVARIEPKKEFYYGKIKLLFY